MSPSLFDENELKSNLSQITASFVKEVVFTLALKFWGRDHIEMRVGFIIT
jgi:hypothetical protein